jgi:phosphomannomutase / phosphoglucomutase
LRGDGSGPRPLQGDTPSGDGAHGNGPLPAAADAPAPTPAETPSARDLDEPLLELDLDLAEDAAQNPAGESAFPDHIFRAYDIRGNAERELNDALVRGIGQVVAELLQERGEQQLVVGSDGRLSSPRIRSQLISALLECGLEVIDIGTVPTPLLHFALHRLDCPSGVMVTGSHNPAEDNGLKIVLDRQTLADGAIQEIRERVLAAGAPVAGYTRGRVRREDVIGTYIAELAGDIAIAMPVKVVIDAGNGTTGLVAPQLFDELGCEVVPLFCEVDGHFPNHSPDTSDEANLAALCSAVRAEGADLGLAFDGDGDRVAVVTGSGKIVRTDRLMMLLAEDVVSRNPGADVVFDVKCSRNLARLVTQLGGRPVLWKTGHAFMKQKVAETGALLGGEFSGHIFFTERWYGHDDGMYAAARLVEILSALDRSLDEALSAFPDPVSTPEIRIPVPERDKFALIGKIAREAVFDGGKINTLDGIRVDFDSGWGLLRASNTSAALTARFEADSEEQLAAIQQAFRDQVGRIAPQLSLPF